MKVDRKFIEEVIEKYDLTSIAATMKDTFNSPSAKIGFIGPFSSGKTSIVNALLGTKLPVDIKPTTKAICVIEPAAGIESPKYFRDTDGLREPVDFMTVCDIINGDSSGDAVVQIKPGEALRNGMVFVDTPGIDSMSREEAELTYSYLAMMDAAVVCIPVDDGTVKKSVVDFICSPMLKPFASRLVFLLTKSDLKSKDSVKSIREEIVRQLRGLCEEGHLAIKDVEIEQKVLAVSINDVTTELLSFLNANFFDNLSRIIAEREEKELHRISAEIVAILSERAGTLSLDSKQYEKAIDEANSALAAIEAEEAQKGQQLTELTDRLQSLLFDVMMSCKGEITSAHDANSRRMAISKMVGIIKNEVVSFCQMHVKSFVPSVRIVAAIDDRLNNALGDIDRFRDWGVTAATAIATAWICPGASAAANASEAAAGAIGQQAAKAGVQATVASAARTVACAAAKEQSFLSKALGSLAKVIKDINPLETVGDFIAERCKASSFDDMVRSSSRSIADRVVSDMAEPYKREVIMPLRIRKEEVRRGLDKQRQLRHEDAEKIRAVHAEMQSEINALQAYSNER